MEEKKENRGGRRVGSGRDKRVESKQIALFLELDLCEALAGVPNRTFFINAAIRYALSKGNEFQKYAVALAHKREEEKKKEKENKKLENSSLVK